jgi:hypothetical protein
LDPRGFQAETRVFGQYTVAAKRVQIECSDLKQVYSRRDFGAGTFLVEGPQAFAAFDLGVGETGLPATAWKDPSLLKRVVVLCRPSNQSFRFTRTKSSSVSCG